MKRTDIKKRPMSDSTLANLEPENTDYREQDSNGWQCHSFGQPIKDGEYITVRASKHVNDIGIALLYSCATDNKVYKEFEVKNDYTLYQGAPYHQDSYAYGVNKYVGPLNAWLVPD